MSIITIPTILILAVIIISLSGTMLSTSLASATTTYEDWNFAAAGDYSCTTNAQLVVNQMRLRQPERVLALGDLSYATTPDCWFNIIGPLDSKTKIAIGNHDDTSSSLLNGYMKHFALRNQAYSFDYRNAHFLVLTTEAPSSTAMLDFARNDLARAFNDPEIDWIIAYMHIPMYNSPTSTVPLAEMRDKYHPLFDRYGVDMVLYGHVHNYERSYPIKYDASGTPSSPIVTTTEKTTYNNDPDGAIFATIGTGGKTPFHPYKSKSSFIVTQTQNQYGFMDVNISGTELQARFLVINSTNPSGDMIERDRFTISK